MATHALSIPTEIEVEPDSLNIEEEAISLVRLADGGNRLRNPSFEDALDPRHWSLRCSDNKVHSVGAVDGANYLGCSDRGAQGEGHPSIQQNLRRLRDGRYRHAFSIYLQNQDNVPRDAQLALWQLINNGSKWVQSATTRPFPIDTEWKKYDMVHDGGGGVWKCEVYWFDTNNGDIRFDKAFFSSIPL